MSILKDYLDITNKAIEEKDISKLALIIKATEDTATEDIFCDGPLSNYWDVEEIIGEKEAYAELSKYWSARGLKFHIVSGIDTIGDFQDYWDSDDHCPTIKEWDIYCSLATYEGHAEFILNHIDHYKNLAAELLDFIVGNVGEEFVADAMKIIAP